MSAGKHAEEQASPLTLYRWAAEHPALAFAVASTLFAAIRIVRIAGGRTETALAIVRELSATELVIATLVMLLPATLVGSLVGLLYWMYKTDGRAAPRWFVVGYAILVLLLTSLGFLLIAALYVAFTFAFRKWIRWRDARKGRAPIYPDYDVVGAMIIFFAVLAPITPWVPSERLTLSDGSSFTAYVLAEDSRSLSVLDREGRTVAYVDRLALAKREICIPERTAGETLSGRSLADVLVEGTTGEYPDCS